MKQPIHNALLIGILPTCLLVLSLVMRGNAGDVKEVDPAESAGLIFGLKPGPGRELVLGYCMPCHSTTLVASNHKTRENWDKTITLMQSKNGMPPIPADIRKQILDYLEVAQRIEDPVLTESSKTPWATPIYRPNPIW